MQANWDALKWVVEEESLPDSGNNDSHHLLSDRKVSGTFLNMTTIQLKIPNEDELIFCVFISFVPNRLKEKIKSMVFWPCSFLSLFIQKH